MGEWVVILIMLGLAWFWWDSHAVLDRARAAARQFCAAQGLQLLDDTVASVGMRLARDDDGRLIIARAYQFGFSDTGNNRLASHLVMLGRRVGPMHLQAYGAHGRG